MKKNAYERIGELLELPKEVVSNEPKLTIIGFNELVIENYKGILDYEDTFIRINTHIGSVGINGVNLNLKQITEEIILITGTIENIELEKNM